MLEAFKHCNLLHNILGPVPFLTDKDYKEDVWCQVLEKTSSINQFYMALLCHNDDLSFLHKFMVDVTFKWGYSAASHWRLGKNAVLLEEKKQGDSWQFRIWKPKC